MIILTYSETNAKTIKDRLGEADYSYYFIYKKYLPAMEKLGKVISVRDPATEVDKIYRENPDEPCIFLSFTPPHNLQLGLECPTVCVFAWEYSTIPMEHWDNNPKYNWAAVLTNVGNALTISEYAVAVTRKAVPQGINMDVIPAAVDTTGNRRLKRKRVKATIDVEATLYDSDSYNLSTDNVDDAVRSGRHATTTKLTADNAVEISFTENDQDSIDLLVGFYSSEKWGTWSRTGSPWIILPYTIQGPVVLALELVAYGTNIDREIEVEFGAQSTSFKPDGLPAVYEFEFSPDNPEDKLKFKNIDLTHAPGARDHRSLGIGIKKMVIRRPEGFIDQPESKLTGPLNWLRTLIGSRLNVVKSENLNTLELNGIVYTTVMNPEDGRKNWEDMVTAFCWAFRDREDATLVLKMTHKKLTTFLGKLLLLYSQMSPFKCRVVAVHGFLSEEQYQQLIDSTHFVVNSSHCEGQCLPLMEFMGQGIPAVAPDHTAMADYLDDSNAFIVKSSLYPTCWPIDHRQTIRTKCYRIDWSSLKDAFLASYDVVHKEPRTYESMRRSSIQSVENTAGQNVVRDRMKHYLEKTARRAADS